MHGDLFAPRPQVYRNPQEQVHDCGDRQPAALSIERKYKEAEKEIEVKPARHPHCDGRQRMRRAASPSQAAHGRKQKRSNQHGKPRARRQACPIKKKPKHKGLGRKKSCQGAKKR